MWGSGTYKVLDIGLWKRNQVGFLLEPVGYGNLPASQKSNWAIGYYHPTMVKDLRQKLQVKLKN